MQKNNPQNTRGPLQEIGTELYQVVRQSIAESWLVRIALACSGALILLLIWTRLASAVFTAQGFGPHGACLLWLPGLITLYVGSDTFIGTAYVSISLTLVYLVYATRRAIPFHWVFIAFGVFIIACGTTHYMDILTLWVPVYWLAGMVKLLTAIASVTTAIALPPLIPRVLSLVRSAQLSNERQRQLEEAHQVLQQEVVTQKQDLVLLAKEVTVQIQENRQALEALQLANEQLAHASQMQSNFVATVSHEFRTALTSIQGFSGMMKDEAFSQEEVKRFSSDIFDQSQRLTRMIDDLLNLERIKSGEMKLYLESVDMNELIREVFENFQPIAPRHVFTLHLNGTAPQCLGDRDKLTQVLANLLSNAIKYSPDGSEISVGSQVEQDMVKVWIRDHGIGIPAESLEGVFTPYARIEKDTRHIKGTGLGLAITRQIIEKQRGRIWVESKIGEGSCFYFALPTSLVEAKG